MYPLTFVSAVMYSIFFSCNSRKPLQCSHSPAEPCQRRFLCLVDKFAVSHQKPFVGLLCAYMQKAAIADSPCDFIIGFECNRVHCKSHSPDNSLLDTR